MKNKYKLEAFGADEEFDSLITAVKSDCGNSLELSICGVVLWIYREDFSLKEDFLDWLQHYDTDVVKALFSISNIDNVFEMVPLCLRRDGNFSADWYEQYGERIITALNLTQQEKKYHGSTDEAIEKKIDEAVGKNKSC